jgi:hypothetical protein
MNLARRVGRLRRRIAAFFARLHAPQWVSLALIAVTLICAAVLGWLVYETSLDKDTQLWGKAFLFLIGLLTALATVAVSWEPTRCSAIRRMMSPFGAGLVLMAVFGAFGTMTSALSLFEPRAATQEDTDAIGRVVAGTDRTVRELALLLKQRFPDDPPILEQIAGRWGEQEPACALVWDISVRKVGDHAALIAEIVERPPAVEPFRLVAEITGARGDTLYTTGEEPEQARGKAAVFTYNGATRRLVWDDKQSQGGVEEYRPCPQP